MTTSPTFQKTDSFLLRRTLQLDAASALLGAIAFVIIAVSPLAGLTGFSEPALVWAIVAVLVVYTAWLLWITRTAEVDTRQAMIAVTINDAWVVGSIVVLVLPGLTVLGKVLIGVMAVIVGIFAGVELYAVRRAR